ncbi:hypothetical protein ACFFU9_09210 [Mariniflexile ostreae]|uniref:NERD domain-containing protein n=1 Tax=Mariniflexile ostreae TaxID=1520892 RepID=A0ABV5FBV4_9FLAO
MPDFKRDLKQEEILSRYLDNIYKSKKLKFERICDINQQLQGIDIVIHHHKETYFIDEKAQLHYLNKDLPTFTFELSYLNKNNQIKEGWLLDNHKLTQYYFLITGIFLKANTKTLSHINDIEKLKIISVNKHKLIKHLARRGVTQHKLQEYDYDIRKTASFGKNIVAELKEKDQGLLYYTAHLSEKPINLQLRLDYLIRFRIAKKIHDA